MTASSSGHVTPRQGDVAQPTHCESRYRPLSQPLVGKLQRCYPLGRASKPPSWCERRSSRLSPSQSRTIRLPTPPSSGSVPPPTGPRSIGTPCRLTGYRRLCPFFDRQVVQACLSVLPWERTDPWCPKPLLRTAFDGLFPADVLSRRTKGEYNADLYHGWSIQRQQVTGLLCHSRLVEHGLIDPVKLRAALATFGRDGLPPAWITDLIAVEIWLRDLAPPFSARQEAKQCSCHHRSDRSAPGSSSSGR